MIGYILCFFTKLVCGLTTRWIGCEPSQKQRVYFANHTSHLDFLVIWTSLPREIRKNVRPVAAKDYWGKGILRKYLSSKIIKAVLIDRDKTALKDKDKNPLNKMVRALEENSSLIIFPEGTRCNGDKINNFKSGLYHLIKKYPQAEFVPVYIENLNRIFPKGEFYFIPILGSVTFGTPIYLKEDELKKDFLNRARQSIEEISQQL